MITGFLGEEKKIKVWVDPVDGMTLDDFEWEAILWCSSRKKVTIPKSEAIPLGDGVFSLMLNTEMVGTGTLKIKIVGMIPDGDFPDGLRTTMGADSVMQILADYVG